MPQSDGGWWHHAKPRKPLFDPMIGGGFVILFDG